MDSQLPIGGGTKQGTNLSEACGLGCPRSQESWGCLPLSLCPQQPLDLMSSPLRKRIRSPDLREALSAGLLEVGREGGQLSRDLPPGSPMLLSCLLQARERVGGRRSEEPFSQIRAPEMGREGQMELSISRVPSWGWATVSRQGGPGGT